MPGANRNPIHSHEEERDRDPEDAKRAPQAERRAPSDSLHHPQNDQPDDVIDDCGAEDQPGLDAVEQLQVLEHARRNAHRRGGQRGPDEDRRRQGIGDRVLIPVPPRAPVHKPRHERHCHSDDGHGRRTGADALHRIEFGVEPNLEQQHHDPDLGEQPEDRRERIARGHGNHLEEPGAQHDAGQELAHDRRLPQALKQLAGELADQQHHREHGEEPGDVNLARGVRGEGRQGQEGQRGQRGQH